MHFITTKHYHYMHGQKDVYTLVNALDDVQSLFDITSYIPSIQLKQPMDQYIHH